MHFGVFQDVADSLLSELPAAPFYLPPSVSLESLLKPHQLRCGPKLQFGISSTATPAKTPNLRCGPRRPHTSMIGRRKSDQRPSPYAAESPALAER